MNSLCEKLVGRHPHVFGDATVKDEVEVKRNWELLKLKEKGGNQTVLAGVPKSLPALIKEDVWKKVEEEVAEFKACFEQEDAEFKACSEREEAESEFGDLLFSLVNYARFIDINPENALEKTNKKVIKRFNYIEAAIQRDGKQLHESTLEEMDAYWDEAKRLEKNQ